MKSKKLVLVSIIYIFLSSTNLMEAGCPLRAATNAKVLYFLNKKTGVVQLNIGKLHGVNTGSVFYTYRLHLAHNGESIKIKTGQVKIDRREETTSVAKVIDNYPAIEDSQFAPQAGVMAGDFLEAPKFVIRKRQQSLPELNVAYFEIFKEPNRNTSNYSLSHHGKEYLSKLVSIYMGAKVSKLIISGFTDSEGTESENQVESHQRALTVKNYLVETLGFDRDRIIALGFGETKLKDESNVVDHKRRNRRIVISANSHN